MRTPRSRFRMVAIAVASIVVIVGLGLVAYFTPLMSVRSTDVVDNRAVPTDQIVDAARVPDGTPLLQVDTRQVAQRVAAIPTVESARVQRSYPSSLTITVTERAPVALVRDGDKVHVLDKTGVGYLTFDRTQGVPPEVLRLPEFVTPNPGPSDPTTRAAMTAVAGLPDPIARLLVKVTATSPVDIGFVLKGNKTVVWGDANHGDEKARTLSTLMGRDATMINVSSPEFPAYR